MFEHLRSSTPRAAKVHKCSWCGEDIVIGEKHHYVVGLFEGEIQNQRLHNECETAKENYYFDDPHDNEGFEEHGFKRGSTDQR